MATTHRHPRRLALPVLFLALYFVVHVGAWSPFGQSSPEAVQPPPPQQAESPSPTVSDVFGDNKAASTVAAAPVEAGTPVDFLHATAPQVKQTPAPYPGLEYRWKHFRFRPADYKREGLTLAGLVGYIGLMLYGKSSNKKRALTWWNAHRDVLDAQFAQVGTTDRHVVTPDGPSTVLGYATGRRGVSGLHANITLRPRHDLVMLAYEEIRSILDASWTHRGDTVELEWNLTSSTDGDVQQDFDAKDAWVWALVNKRAMTEVRNTRWDVGTFTETKETPLIPPKFVVMSESGEITDAIFKHRELDLSKFLTGEDAVKSVKYLESLIVSGTRYDSPSETELPLPSVPKCRTVTLRLKLPPTSSSSDTVPLLQLGCDMVDALSTLSLSSTLTPKLNRRRVEVSEFLLEDSKKEEAEAKEDKRRKALKEKQDEKLKSMSPAEQRKWEEKERKRQMTKQQSRKMVRK